MMKRLLYILLGISLAACCNKASKAPQVEEPENSDTVLVTNAQFELMNMAVDTVGMHRFEKVIPLSGIVDVPPQYKAIVSTLVDGYIKDIYVQEGESVRAGQLLFTLDSPEFLQLQKDYLEYCSQLDFLESEYIRQKTLFAENIVSKKKFLEAESNYKVAKASVLSLKQLLSQLNANVESINSGNINKSIHIYASISGDITKVYVTKGQPISKSDLVAEIINPKEKVILLSVYEKDIFDIYDGQELSFTIPQAPEMTFRATVHKIGKSLNGSERTISVQAVLTDKTKTQLIVGMIVHASIIVKAKEYLSVPYEALISKDGVDYILKLNKKVENGYSFILTPVETGVRNEDLVEIIPSKEVSQGVNFLSKGAYDIL